MDSQDSMRWCREVFVVERKGSEGCAGVVSVVAVAAAVNTVVLIFMSGKRVA